MILEGLKLTFLGMLVVFAFLTLLVIVVRLSSKILKPLTDKEALAFTFGKPKGPRPSTDSVDRRLMAVISAAIAAHRRRMQV
jgi:sodium pump decarboxylase gamma subunit